MKRIFLCIALGAVAPALSGCAGALPIALTVLGAVSSAESLGHDVLGIDFALKRETPSAEAGAK